MDPDGSADGYGSGQEGDVGPGDSDSKGKTEEQMATSGSPWPTTTNSFVWRHGTRIIVDGRPRWACQYCWFTLEQADEMTLLTNLTQVKQKWPSRIEMELAIGSLRMTRPRALI
jgi:hypothetical protein